MNSAEKICINSITVGILKCKEWDYPVSRGCLTSLYKNWME